MMKGREKIGVFIAVVLPIMLVILFNYEASAVLAADQGPGGGSASGGFNNPLGGGALSGNGTVSGVLANIVNWMLGLSAILALLALIVGGVRMIISFGNDQGVAAAKKNIQWAIVGLIVILLSYAIIKWVSGVLGVTLSD